MDAIVMKTMIIKRIPVRNRKKTKEEVDFTRGSPYEANGGGCEDSSHPNLGNGGGKTYISTVTQQSSGCRISGMKYTFLQKIKVFRSLSHCYFPEDLVKLSSLSSNIGGWFFN